LLANEGLALAVGASCIFLCGGRDGGHLAVVTLVAQLTQKGAHELLGVEPVGLGTPVFARHRRASRMNDMGLDTALTSQRASQEPSRPVSKSRAMLVILCPAFSARQRSSSFESSFSSAASFFNGWRSTPGMIPATSQFFLLSSTTVINVWLGSNGISERLSKAASPHSRWTMLDPTPVRFHGLFGGSGSVLAILKGPRY
jgi:hypothetical protein